MKTSINKIKEKDDSKSEDYYIKMNEVFENNKNIFRALFRYIYQLKVEENISEVSFRKINKFCKIRYSLHTN